MGFKSGCSQFTLNFPTVAEEAAFVKMKDERPPNLQARNQSTSRGAASNGTAKRYLQYEYDN